MPNNRDDFTKKTIDHMAKRVGYRCSNPNCRKLTCGAAVEPEDYVNIGVAAHICAAAPGGMRYDPHMTTQQRKSIRNGIWLCQSCSKLIDSDEVRYTVKVLHKWKYDAEIESVNQLELNLQDDRNYLDVHWQKIRKSEYCNEMQFLAMLNRKIDELLSSMEIIQQKLDAAIIDDNTFWIRTYEERLASLMALYGNLNWQLTEMAEKGIWVERYVQEINQFEYAKPAFKILLGRKRYDRNLQAKELKHIVDKRVDLSIRELIFRLKQMQMKIGQLSYDVADLHRHRIDHERSLIEIEYME